MYYLIGLHNSHETTSSDCRERHKTRMSTGLGWEWIIGYYMLCHKCTSMLIFQRLLFRHEFLRGAPPSYIVSSYPCGLMTLENSSIVVNFFAVVCPLEDECRKSISFFIVGLWYVRSKMSVGNIFHFSLLGCGMSVRR